jgi:hypothetical protein
LIPVSASWFAASAKATHAPLQWVTLVWVVGAVVVAALVISVIVVVSRRPKSMEDGIAEFSRSLQAVAPRPAARLAASHAAQPAHQGHKTTKTDGPLRGTRRETEAV